jgi:hypothetical protein
LWVLSRKFRIYYCEITGTPDHPEIDPTLQLMDNFAEVAKLTDQVMVEFMDKLAEPVEARRREQVDRLSRTTHLERSKLVARAKADIPSTKDVLEWDALPWEEKKKVNQAWIQEILNERKDLNIPEDEKLFYLNYWEQVRLFFVLSQN